MPSAWLGYGTQKAVGIRYCGWQHSAGPNPGAALELCQVAFELYPTAFERAMAANTAALGLGVRLKVCRSTAHRPKCGL